MICPRCSVAEISPTTGVCELCGYVPDGSVAVDTHQPDATDELARAQLAHQFRIDVLLGQGASSVVYLARENDSNSHIILKVLPRVQSRPDVDQRFRDAIAAAKTLDHPHLVPVLRHGETDSLLWYSMEHRKARPLRDVLRTGGRLDQRACMRYVTQIAGTLDYLHRRGAIHGRLKPENVLVDSEGWVYVCDALVGRALHGLPTTAPRHPEFAAAAYIAPEDTLGGFVGAASDQYTLAVLIHECLTGAVPAPRAVFTADNAPTLTSLRPDLPAHLGHAVARAMNPRPNDRYPTILDFVTALESGSSMMTDARPSGRASDLILTIPDWKPPQTDRPRWIVPTIVIASLLVVGTVAWLLVQRGSGRPDYPTLTQPPARTAPAPAASVPAVDSGARATPESMRDRMRRTELSRPRVVDLRDRSATDQRGRTPATRTPARSTRQTQTAPAPAPAAPVAAPPAGEAGRLFVNASPWGQLFVDGQLVGNTPKANLPVSAGTHTIRVVREGYEPVERTVQVGAGETVRLTNLVLTPRP